MGSCWLLRLHIQRRHQHGPEYAIPANSGRDLSKATDINDGAIVGSGFLHGKKRGLVLMPMVPTPGLSSLSKLIEVVGGSSVRRRLMASASSFWAAYRIRWARRDRTWEITR